jgi:fatty acid desaturase
MDASVFSKEWLRPNSYYSLFGILRNWIVIAAIIWLNIHYWSIWLYIPSVWIIGGFQFTLGECMLHNASHYTLFTKKAWHYRLEFLYSLPFFTTVKLYRKEHLRHHSYLGKPDKDNLIADYEKFGFGKPGCNFFWLWFIKPVIGFPGYFYVRKLTLRPFRGSGIRILIFWTVILSCFAIFHLTYIILLFWIVPWFWCHYSFLYWSEVSDHFHTRTGTRSNLNPITNLLTHNNGYHYMHHKYPTIPWFKLPETYEQLCHGEGDISHGFIDTYRQMKSM